MSFLHQVTQYLNEHPLVLVGGLVSLIGIIFFLLARSKKVELVPGPVFGFPVPRKDGTTISDGPDMRVAHGHKQKGWELLFGIIVFAAILFTAFVIYHSVTNEKMGEKKPLVQEPGPNTNVPANSVVPAVPAMQSVPTPPVPAPTPVQANISADPKTKNDTKVHWPTSLDLLKAKMESHDSLEKDASKHFEFVDDSTNGIRRIRIPFTLIAESEKPKFERRVTAIAQGSKYFEPRIQYLVLTIEPLHASVRVDCIGKKRMENGDVVENAAFRISLPQLYRNMEVNEFVDELLVSVTTLVDRMIVKQGKQPVDKPAIKAEVIDPVVPVPIPDPKKEAKTDPIPPAKK